ncbi:hypothetical protein, partial [Roseiconus lacunae]
FGEPSDNVVSLSELTTQSSQDVFKRLWLRRPSLITSSASPALGFLPSENASLACERDSFYRHVCG